MPSEVNAAVLEGEMHGKCGNPICFNNGSIVNIWDEVRKMHICFICEAIQDLDSREAEEPS
jgi:hypothetical protein